MAVDSNAVPVEIAVLEFPGSGVSCEIVPALAELVDDRIVSILDVVVVSKDVDGSVTTVALADLDPETRGVFDDLDCAATGLLSDDDLAVVAGVLSFGCSALLIVWEGQWARRLIDAVAGSGGRLVAYERLHADSVRDLLAQEEPAAAVLRGRD